MPLELTPIFFKLQRYDASKLLPPAPSAVPAATPPVAPLPDAGEETPQTSGVSNPPAQQ